MITLECLEGGLKGKVLEFEKASIVFGRNSDCDVWLDDPTCSRQHAGIQLIDGSFFAVDFKSTNGILVNGKKVERAPIVDGDRIFVGRSVFVFRSSTAVDAGAPELDIDEMINNTITIDAAEERLLEASGRVSTGEPTQAIEVGELESLRHVNRQMRAVYLLSQAINGTLELRDLYQLITDNVFGNFKDVERVCIFITDKESGEFVRATSQARLESANLPVSKLVLQRVRRQRAGILATDALTDQRFVGSDTVAAIRVRSLMCVPLTTRERVIGAVYVENCTRPHCFSSGDLELLTIFGNHMATALENALLYEELEKSFYETVRSLSKALEAKDRYTRGHSGRVALYSVGIGRELGLPDGSLQHLKIAAELHDIGKIAIPEGIIHSKAKLSEEEIGLIRKHPQYGVEILKPIRFLQPVLTIVLHHHERFDGTGYPDGLAGDRIPLEARILNLADSFDAMTTQRPYNDPRTFAEALAICNAERGRSFDARCVEALLVYVEKRFARTIDQQASNGDKDSASPGRDLSNTSRFDTEEIDVAMREAGLVEEEADKAPAAR
jgi:HD-GYP domain-containing protein (c-di-GMP phosphodiesterase class II)